MNELDLFDNVIDFESTNTNSTQTEKELKEEKDLEIKYSKKPLDKVTITFCIERFPQDEHIHHERSWICEELKKTNIPKYSISKLPKVVIEKLEKAEG